MNRHLVSDLLDRGLWNEDLKKQLIALNGSVQSLDIPADLKELYKTVWEVKLLGEMKKMIEINDE